MATAFELPENTQKKVSKYKPKLYSIITRSSNHNSILSFTLRLVERRVQSSL